MSAISSDGKIRWRNGVYRVWISDHEEGGVDFWGYDIEFEIPRLPEGCQGKALSIEYPFGPPEIRELSDDDISRGSYAFIRRVYILKPGPTDAWRYSLTHLYRWIPIDVVLIDAQEEVKNDSGNSGDYTS